MIHLPLLRSSLRADQLCVQALDPIATLETCAFVHPGSQPENNRLGSTDTGTYFLVGQPSSMNFLE